MWKTELFPAEIRKKTKMPIFTTSIQHPSGGHSHYNEARKINKRYKDWKGGSKTLPICRWYDYLECKKSKGIYDNY